ncbi:MAG TPA: M36 family metallopeptidase [Candidatus Limnocylindria bacterium]|nr:M36 family metallopeptidase [Candidatus Limnocylindria bacterium]
MMLALTMAVMPASAIGARPVNDYLTAPRSGDALDIALAYLRAHPGKYGITGSDLRDVVVTDRYRDAHNGVTHIYLRQRFKGIEIIGSDVNVSVTRDGRIVALNSSFTANIAGKVNAGSAGKSSAAAVKAVARSVGLRPPATLKVKSAKGGPSQAVTYKKNGISLAVIPTKLVYQPVKGKLILSWQVELYEPSAAHWWNTRVDANSGAILARNDYVNDADDRYNVYEIPTENPDENGRTLVVNPATFASPNGWHNVDGDAAREFTNTSGNNVFAYPDRDADNNPFDTASTVERTPPNGALDGTGNLTFDFPIDFTDPPVEYSDAATVNLFYWNNVVHDVLYNYGFDERAGNFQLNNFGPDTPGRGGDPVLAEAQDGSARNNANFATPPDGFAPRMQMFEWRDPAPNPLTVEGFAEPFAGPMAGFGPSLATTGPITGTLFLVNDGAGAPNDGCEAIPAQPAGVQIALMDRGTCNFTVKVKNAQLAGAEAAVVVNNVAGDPFGMGGGDPTITIPSIMISLADGTEIKPELPAQATLAPNPDLQPDRDSDLDSGVIIHEYGHGVSNRLTGGPGAALCLQNAEQMGEGWSDFLALMLTQRSSDTATTSRGMGNYLQFEGPDGVGIRPTPYTTDMDVNPSTYQDVIDTNGVTLTIPHGVGYVWASILWDMNWNLIADHGYNADIYDAWDTGGNNLALQLVMDGMKFQRCRPGFVSGRDAILDADLALTGGDNQCAIWEAFAGRGVGINAAEKSTNKTGDGMADFGVPAGCGSANGVIAPLLPALTASEIARRSRRRRTARR